MIKYTDLYVNTIARGLLTPGEQLLAAAAGTHQPFWSLQIPWFKHAYLVLATSERLIVVDHRRGLFFDRLDTVAQHRWSELGGVQLSGLFSKKLVVRDASNRVLFKVKPPPALLSPRPNNGAALKAVAQTWQQRRGLAAGPATPALPGAYPQIDAQPT